MQLPRGVDELIEVREPFVLSTIAHDPAADLPANDPGLLRAHSLRIGTWMLFQPDTGSTLRCRLTAIMAPANRYIFVSRTGLKVLEQNAGQLALAFKRGTLQTLDDGPLFERALAAVMGKLRQLNRGK